jgi:hypothetical protein
MSSLYIAATGQHVGKTTSTLGLVANFRNMGVDTGYCKPVGQKHLTVDGKLADKDAVLFSSFIGFEMIPELHSPVILGRGVTKEFLDDPSRFDFEDKLDFASEALEGQHELVIYEGTGHPGVGSIVDLSNADVAKRLNAGVVMVVEGGIGRTLDKLIMSMALFREQNVPLLGVIVNKVRTDKLDEVGYYLSKKLNALDIPILGLLPYDQTLSYPIMETISQAVDGNVILNEQHLSKRVEDIVSGSLVDMDEFSTFHNTLLVVSERRLNEAIAKVREIAQMKNLKHSPISGVIVTGDGRHMRWFNKGDLDNPYFKEHKVPVVTTKLDTLGSVVKISRIEVKINTRTPWKIKRAIALIRKHVDFELLKDRMEQLTKKTA